MFKKIMLIFLAFTLCFANFAEAASQSDIVNTQTLSFPFANAHPTNSSSYSYDNLRDYIPLKADCVITRIVGNVKCNGVIGGYTRSLTATLVDNHNSNGDYGSLPIGYWDNSDNNWHHFDVSFPISQSSGFFSLKFSLYQHNESSFDWSFNITEIDYRKYNADLQ